MDPVKSANDFRQRLFQAEQAAKDWRRWMNRVAEGEIRLDTRSTEQYRLINASIIRLLRELTDGVVVMKVKSNEINDAWGSLPEPTKEAYRNLWERIYGSRALKLGDDIGKAPGKALRGRMSTGKDEVRGGAKPGKSLSASQRSTILDQQAWQFKRTIDRRLRQVTTDIRLFLDGSQAVAHRVTRCTRCGKVGEVDWKFCPRCGHETEVCDEF